MYQTESFDFLDQICQKRVFPVQIKTNEHYHLIHQTQISLDTDSHLKQRFLSFWTIFPEKEYSRFQTEKMNITIEFSIFE